MVRLLLARAFLLGTACAALGACESISGGPRTTEIVTDPPGALVRVEGYGECLSPCVIEFDAPRTIIVAKEGFRAQRLAIKPGKARILLKLDLVAPTTDVEETEMPKL